MTRCSYVMDRREQPSRLGNMLTRPSLLLEVQEIGGTQTRKEQLSAGNEGQEKKMKRKSAVHSSAHQSSRMPVLVWGLPCRAHGCLLAGGARQHMGGTNRAMYTQQLQGGVSSLDWLPRRATALVNLKPDAEGWVQVSLQDLNLPSGGR